MQKDSHQREMHGALASLTPPSGAAEDWTVPQRWDELTAEDHWVWDTLFARQQTLLHGRAVEAFERGLDMLHLSRSDEHTSELQSLMRNSYAVFCLKTTNYI